jgi:threonine/homoserine/homoserine lactone efflux protein
VSLVLISLLTGALLGLSVAAPFGPISLLCVQRSIAAGPRLGIVTGLGAACVQCLYATLAITGASAVAAQLADWSQPVRLISSALLVFLGARVLMRRPPAIQPLWPLRARKAFATSFAVALCNPLTIMPYLLVASAGAAAGAGHASLTGWSVPGVLFGATAWYAIVSTAAALFRSTLPRGAIRALNHVAGVGLIGFGLVTGLA